MGWTKTDALVRQSDNVFDGRFPDVERPAITDSAIDYVKSVSQHGVDFVFDNYVLYGGFIEDRYFWVKDAGYGLNITRITPEGQLSAGDGVTKINGAMLNPVDSESHGYDSRSGQDMTYDNALNVDPGNTGQNLVLSPGDSVIKSISRELGVDRPVLTDTVILTAVSSIPPVGSFRPAYNSNTEAILANESDLDYTKLGSHALLGDTPAIDSAPYDTLLNRPWLEHNTEWTSREIRAVNNQINPYGVDFARPLGEAAVLLNMGFTNAQKRSLLIDMVQYGLDIYAFASTGSDWPDNGGQNPGRKLPLLIAGRVLNDPAILAYADAAQHFIYHDDRQTFYVSQTEVDVTNGGTWDPDYRITSPEPYTSGDIGLAEWGVNHTRDNTSDTKSWDHPYRGLNNGVIYMHALAANLMSAEAQWNHPAYFDYADRMYAIDFAATSDWKNSIWSAYKT